MKTTDGVGKVRLGRILLLAASLSLPFLGAWPARAGEPAKDPTATQPAPKAQARTTRMPRAKATAAVKPVEIKHTAPPTSLTALGSRQASVPGSVVDVGR